MTAQREAKILFVDMESPLGHIDVNYFFIKHVFPHVTDYYYMVERDLYERILAHCRFRENPPVVYFPEHRKRSMSKISARMLFFKKAKFILDFIQKNDISSVFFLSYDTLSLSYYMNKFSAYKVILMNHDNIARFIRNPLRRFILKRLKKLIHVVYVSPHDTSILLRLRQMLEFQKILPIEHHIDDSRNTINMKSYNPNSVFLYAPSNGNDDKKIINLLGTMEDNAVAIKAKVSAGAYHRFQKHYGENLFFGFLEHDEFEKEMNRADFILLLYPDDYTFRTSGMVFDAIAYEKPVITDNRFLYETYLENNRLGIFVDNAFAVGNAVSQIDESKYISLVENIKNYKRSYSAEKIGNDFATKINRILES